MSYARSSSPGSDVYIFGSGTHLECYINNDVLKLIGDWLPREYAVPFDDKGTAQKAMLGHCYYLMDQGVRIPGYTIRRLIQEICEIEDDLMLEDCGVEIEKKENG